ncbi:hypothetical protein [Parasitella parasitica]|uniref:Uncharacterized protein n=1 Tax=Parasitella parasitica TaxID=35722 RepID=A0A0B7NKW6_9FUNG|nr:hypothetical protein [Parasitella parasitica]
MEALNTVYPPESTDPLRAPATAADTTNHSTLQNIKEKIVDIKDNVKETLQRDHHNGQDCAKKPQDGKTNPME